MPDKDEPTVAIDLIFDLGSIAIAGRLTETRAIQLVLIALHWIALKHSQESEGIVLVKD